MAVDIITGLGIFKTLFDSAKGLKDINDTAVLNTAVVELQEKILAAQAQQAALIEHVHELEKEVARFETWETEKQRYQLHDCGGRTFAYVLKESEQKGEPAHEICANCYEHGQKSVLQTQLTNSYGQRVVACPACKTEFNLGARTNRRAMATQSQTDYDPFSH